MTQIAVTDAHPLIWYAKGHLRKLGPAARRVFTAAENGRCIIYVPILALVEVLEASRLGGIKLNSSADQWTEQLFSSGAFLPVNLTTEIVLRAGVRIAADDTDEFIQSHQKMAKQATAFIFRMRRRFKLAHASA